MSDHGSLYDRFAAQAEHGHDGATFDGGFGLQGLMDPHGEQFDKFTRHPTAGTLKGEHFDEFGWRDVPTYHGHTFDSDFRDPMALDGADGHATWFDAFRGGAQVRYSRDGADYEGTVIDLNREYATVESGGQRHEIAIGQVLQWRDAVAPDLGPTGVKPTAEPGKTDTSVVRGPQGERPSGESSTAMGGGRTDGPSPGWETTALHVAGKTADDETDVEKAVDSTETAVEREDHDGDDDDRKAHCPHCHHTCKKPKDGKCPECGHKVVYKTRESLVDVAKALRELAGVA